MKNNPVALPLMVVMILGAATPVFVADSVGALEQWSVSLVEANDSPATWFGTTSIALDSMGAPHICYRICGEGSSIWYSVKHAELQSESWGMSRIDGGGNAATSLPTSIAFDTDGTIHVGYSNVTAGEGCIKYSNNSEGDWAITDVSDSWGGSMCLDSMGVAHMCYPVSVGLWGALAYSNNSEGDWGPETIIDSNHRGRVSMTIDSDDSIHIACTTSDVNYSILYVTNSGGTWETSIVDAFGRNGAISVDSMGSPRIVYVGRELDQDAVKCAKLVEGSWMNSTVDIGEQFDLYPSIAIDSEDHTHLSYAVYTSTSSTLVHAVDAGDEWIESVVECFEADNQPYLGGSSIAVGELGDVHISYMRGQGSDHDAGGGLKYATAQVSEIPEMSSSGLVLAVATIAAVLLIVNRNRR